MRAWIVLLPLLVACQKEPVKQVESKAPFVLDKATAATLKGTVVYRGKPDAAVVVDMDQDPGCQALYKSGARRQQQIVVDKQGGLGNVYLYIASGLPDREYAVPKEPVTIDQRGCWFEPRVMGVMAGQPFAVTNSDPVTHNIHPMPEKNREWNQSQAPGDEPLERRFVRPEVMIPVKCNVHRWMRAWVGVTEHPYFAVTGVDGSFALPALPPGDYTLVAWHEKLGRREERVKLSERQQLALTIELRGE
jgi:plastocyanin